MNTLENFHKTLLEAFVISEQVQKKIWRLNFIRLVPERSPWSEMGECQWVFEASKKKKFFELSHLEPWHWYGRANSILLIPSHDSYDCNRYRFWAQPSPSHHLGHFLFLSVTPGSQQLNCHGPSLLGFEIGNSGLGALLRSIIRNGERWDDRVKNTYEDLFVGDFEAFRGWGSPTISAMLTCYMLQD